MCDQRCLPETLTQCKSVFKVFDVTATKRATQTSLSRLVVASLYQRKYTFPTCVRDSERAHQCTVMSACKYNIIRLTFKKKTFFSNLTKVLRAHFEP